MQRLCDKHHSWKENGVGGLIPGTLIQGLTGHPFGSPDMIGGGEYLSFWEDYEKKFEPELFVRYCEVAALTPVMQFSAAAMAAFGRGRLSEGIKSHGSAVKIFATDSGSSGMCQKDRRACCASYGICIPRSGHGKTDGSVYDWRYTAGSAC